MTAMLGGDLCQQDCGVAATQVVATVNGWLIDVCDEHARQMCDPLSTPSGPQGRVDA